MTAGLRSEIGRPGTRRQYFHDPAAPAPDGLLPAAYAAVRNVEGQVLLVRRTDDGNWELPGGRVDVGESASQAVIREVAEEADITIKVTGVSGVYSDPGHVLAYPQGEVRQQVAVCFHAWAVDCDAHADDCETSAAGWFDPSDVVVLAMHPTMRQRLEHALTAPDRAHFD
ncbi:MAG TPA: NUDIX domain-containing protein [Nocardioidaceae bacterium]|nr:NUDIX domain-containing protein [Nocardioidaceae bacterium]